MKKNILPPIIAAVVTAAGCFFTKNLWNVWAGPVLIFFFTIWSLQVSITNKWKFNRLGTLPCLIGIFGALLNQYNMIGGFAIYMGSEPEPLSYYGLISGVMDGISMSFEMLLLGSGLSLALYTICISAMACQKKPIE